MINNGQVKVAGEVTTQDLRRHPGIIRDKISRFGYDSGQGLRRGVLRCVGLHRLPVPDIAQGVNDAFEYARVRAPDELRTGTGG